MFRKLNNRILMIALVGLLAVVVGVYLTDRGKGERSFKESLVQTDSDKIDQIQLLPKNVKERGIEFKRSSGNWTVSQNGTGYPADNSAVMDLISLLNPLKTESVVSRNPEHFKDYDLVDSIATRVKLMQGSIVIADLLIGKLEMSSNQNMSTFVRPFNDKVVYSVAGYLSMNANRNIDSFRSPKVVDGNKADWSKLEFTYPADSSFILEKQSEGKWHIGMDAINLADVDKFLDPLQNLNNSKFAAHLPPSGPIYKLKISGNKLAVPVELEGYADSSKNIVISSSLNNGNLFEGKELMDKVFPGKKLFLKK
jgi:hypothetical protein